MVSFFYSNFVINGVKLLLEVSCFVPRAQRFKQRRFLTLGFGCAVLCFSLGCGESGAPRSGSGINDIGLKPTDTKAACVNEDPEPIHCGANCSTLNNGGPVNNRIALALIGDGFTQSDLAEKYTDLADQLVEYMFTNSNDSEPYVRYRRFINFYRIDLSSNESGVDKPGQDIWVDTALDGENTCTDYTIGMCQVNWEKTHDAFDAAIADSDVATLHWRLVTLNTEEECGAAHYPDRGNLAVYCPYQSQSPDIALHEGGHAFHGLGDTYWDHDEAYQGDEPTAVNLSLDSTGEKWSHWLGYVDPILGEVGAYEGGALYRYDIYHPTLNQKMGSEVYCHHPGPPYCPHDPVSREKIILDIYEIVDPLDSWTDNSSVLQHPETLEVDVVDCDVITVDWWIDGELVAEDGGESLRLDDFSLSSGQHHIEAHAHDDTEWVRLDRSSMEQRISWTVNM